MHLSHLHLTLDRSDAVFRHPVAIRHGGNNFPTVITRYGPPVNDRDILIRLLIHIQKHAGLLRVVVRLVINTSRTHHR